MQLTGYKHTKNQVYFSSTKISRTVVRDMNDMPVKAWFSRLNLSDLVDAAAMEKVKEKWTEQKEVNFVNDIYKKFEDKKPIYAIELDSPEGTLYDKLLCLSSSYAERDTFELDFIQASPNSSFSAPKGNREYKGAGTALMYELVKIAKIEGSKLFELFPLADDFYKKLGMVERNLHMTFDRHEMGDFLKRQKAEFDLLLQKQPAKTEKMVSRCS